MASFSIRHGFQSTKAEILVRQEAPDNLRWIIVEAFYESDTKGSIALGRPSLKPSALRDIICKTLRKRPDSSNWSEFPNIDDEARWLIDQCEWYRVYDIIEAICDYLPGSGRQVEMAS